MLIYKYLPDPILQKLPGIVRRTLRACHHRIDLVVHRGCQLPGLSDQLIDHRMNLSPLLLGVDQDAVPFALVLFPGLLFKIQCLVRALPDTDTAHPAVLIKLDPMLSHGNGSKRTFLDAQSAKTAFIRTKF